MFCLGLLTLVIMCGIFQIEMSMKPLSCDTFVALHSATEGDCVIFGKNSDRPCAEVQEVVYYPLKDHEPGSKLEVLVFH